MRGFDEAIGSSLRRSGSDEGPDVEVRDLVKVERCESNLARCLV